MGVIHISENKEETFQSDYRKADFTHMLEVWGNDNADMGFALFYGLTMRLWHARKKHPVFAQGAAHALGVIGSEYHELVQAVEHETPERQVDEAMDVAVNAIRMMAGEHNDQ